MWSRSNYGRIICMSILFVNIRGYVRGPYSNSSPPPLPGRQTMRISYTTGGQRNRKSAKLWHIEIPAFPIYMYILFSTFPCQEYEEILEGEDNMSSSENDTQKKPAPGESLSNNQRQKVTLGILQVLIMSIWCSSKKTTGCLYSCRILIFVASMLSSILIRSCCRASST
jgi:hypothetical protein